MRVLILYNNYSRPDDRTRINFLKKLSKFCDVKIYGPYVKDVTPMTPMHFSKFIPLDEVADIFKPDILFFVFFGTGAYNIKAFTDISKYGIPSVILEEDHYIPEVEEEKKVLDWYKSSGISLLLRRHSYKSIAPIPSVWFPFSGNEEEFKPTHSKKINRIGFVGSLNEQIRYYDVRRRAFYELATNDLMSDKSGYVSDPVEYARYLNSHKGILACAGGRLHTCLAKTFEIQLSGAALLSNKIDHADILFDGSKCYFEYEDDCTNIIDVAKLILSDSEEVTSVVKTARKTALKLHSDKARIEELYSILTTLKAGKEIPRKWGQ